MGDAIPTLSSDPLSEARRILKAPAAHCIMSTPEWRALTAGLVADIERMLGGDFTATEIHGFCHKLPETVSPRQFADGCSEYQRKLFGCAPEAEDAERWRTLIGCRRVRVLGYARHGPKGQDGAIRHIGFEFTTDGPADIDGHKEGVETLIEFADAIRAGTHPEKVD